VTGARLAVPLDVRPDQCPNKLKLGSTEALNVAVAGTATFDVRQIDRASLRLEGVAPPTNALSDVTTPYSPYTGRTRPDQCVSAGPDGIRDLGLKFSNQAVVAALGAGHHAGDVVVLHLTGSLKDGTPIAGEDVVVLN
jgi:hypothetical protein